MARQGWASFATGGGKTFARDVGKSSCAVTGLGRCTHRSERAGRGDSEREGSVPNASEDGTRSWCICVCVCVCVCVHACMRACGRACGRAGVSVRACIVSAHNPRTDTHTHTDTCTCAVGHHAGQSSRPKYAINKHNKVKLLATLRNKHDVQVRVCVVRRGSGCVFTQAIFSSVHRPHLLSSPHPPFNRRNSLVWLSQILQSCERSHCRSDWSGEATRMRRSP